MRVKVEVSNRHVHLTKEVLSKLFGERFELTEKYKLSQPGEFASTSTVTIKTDKATITKVRVVGPTRDYTQVEISKSDAEYLGINPPMRNSGDLKNTPGITIIGPKGEVFVDNSVIIANRHLHIHLDDAKNNNLRNNEVIKAYINNKEMNDIYVKAGDNYTTALHIDKDDAEKFEIIKDTTAVVSKRSVILSFIIFFLEVLIFIMIIDFVCSKFLNTESVLPRREKIGNNEVYKAFGYKIYKCKYKDGSSNIIVKGFNSNYSCPKNDIEIKDKTGDNCANTLLQIYEDEQYKYYFSCLKDVYVMLNNNTEIKINKALADGEVKINELEEKGVRFIKEIK